MKSFCQISLCMMLVGAMSQVSLAIDPAIHDAGWKVRGTDFNGATASTYQQHAQDYARQLYYQVQIQPAAPKKVLQEQAAAVKKNIEMSSKDLEALKAAHKNDAEVQKLITSILDHQAKALKHCDHLGDCCAKGTDEVEIAVCCADIDTELEAAKADMKKLLKHLKIEPLPPPKKIDSKAGPKK